MKKILGYILLSILLVTSLSRFIKIILFEEAQGAHSIDLLYTSLASINTIELVGFLLGQILGVILAKLLIFLGLKMIRKKTKYEEGQVLKISDYKLLLLQPTSFFKKISNYKITYAVILVALFSSLPIQLEKVLAYSIEQLSSLYLLPNFLSNLIDYTIGKMVSSIIIYIFISRVLIALSGVRDFTYKQILKTTLLTIIMYGIIEKGWILAVRLIKILHIDSNIIVQILILISTLLMILYRFISLYIPLKETFKIGNNRMKHLFILGIASIYGFILYFLVSSIITEGLEGACTFLRGFTKGI